MDTPEKFLHLVESKSKDLVPVLKGSPLHSLHNPKREAEVFASNHLAHLSRSPNVLVLGLGFGYHIDEMCKILQLRHKKFNLTVIEAHKEIVTLWKSYQKPNNNIEVFSAKTAAEIYSNEKICHLLLAKPIVIVHQASFEAARPFYQALLEKRASNKISDLIVGDKWWDEWAQKQTESPMEVMQGQSEHALWLKAYWELKHAEQH